ncbi:MAG: D-alanyl-D-alanine carboxypeptidase family protein [Geitlerinemataceae cyanobacterium]
MLRFLSRSCARSAIAALLGAVALVATLQLGAVAGDRAPILPMLPRLPFPERLLPAPVLPLPELDCGEVSDTSFYGHLPYPEADRGDLVSVGSVLLHRDAAIDFNAMRRSAAATGVYLTDLSGFRSVAIQQDLFYGIAAARGQTLAQRARVSAPPGHSEHHTGYTIDIGDATAAWADFQTGFDGTTAGRWLLANAGDFNFELSFPPEHDCVSYEPWHWRWVGDDRSRELFETARRYDKEAGIDRQH